MENWKYSRNYFSSIRFYSHKRYDKMRSGEGDDAKRFHKYMENSLIAEKGYALIRKAMRLNSHIR